MVVKLGVEIEIAGALTNATDNAISALNGVWERTSDGSVKCSHNAIRSSNYSNICEECARLGVRSLEFRTTRQKPYTVNMRNINATVEKIASDFKTILDTLEHVSANKSCGIHFHFSGIKKFSVFLSRDFFDAVKAKYTAMCTTERERERLNNHFCEWVYNPYESERYRAINIWGAYERHKTFEFRFFPSTSDTRVFKKYILFVLELLLEVQTTTYDPIKKSVSVETGKEEQIINMSV